MVITRINVEVIGRRVVEGQLIRVRSAYHSISAVQGPDPPWPKF